MKTRIPAIAIGCLVITGTVLQSSCNKSDSAIASSTTSSGSEIAVASSASVANPDSVYIIHNCDNRFTRDSVAQSELPAATTTYLEANYSGYLFSKAFSVTDTTGTISGYVVIIYFNDKPVGLEFDSNGDFLKILEQREFDRSRHGRRHKH